MKKHLLFQICILIIIANNNNDNSSVELFDYNTIKIT